ncbi:SDR family oxidoreductase [Corynebacterium sp. TAE3-ERU12]|uniref:SDR family oxidoreductase n=1 Tax=Corynebacterium sp. TAE3-ERU12 TaxID=2849491 RepID=UPI001C49566A|nr:SDR family oxidoreductase [Corynebacterium sp. TAE3-ERU12]MBV7295169.1 SDR family oxidoreductase [Corynebacterium sp. TAE3-ERU12]
MNSPHRSHTGHAVVTGGGGGIGRAVAFALIQDGWTVTVCGRSADNLAATVSDPRSAGRIDQRVCDISDESSVAALFDYVADTHHRVDLLVANAGTPGPAAEFGQVPADEFRATVDTNLVGTFLTCQEAFRRMRGAGGRIIINASIAAQVPRPHTAAYAATKSALRGLSKVISLDGRAYGITCGRIDIGNAATELLDGFGAQSGALQPDGSHKVEPTFSVADAARAVALMASMPPEAVVDELTVTAAGMPFVGRG